MSESFEIDIKTFADTKAVKALQDALNKISGVLSSFISVSDKSGVEKYLNELKNLAKAIDENSEKYIKLNAAETERIMLANEQKALEEKILNLAKNALKMN